MSYVAFVSLFSVLLVLPGQNVQAQTSVLRVSIEASPAFDGARRERLLRGAELLERVVNSPEFEKAVLEATYDGARGFADSQGLSNAQILERIRIAKERLNGREDGVLNLEVDLYYTRRNVVGYTYPNVSKIWVNTRYFDRYAPAQIAANLMHEWLHKIGFEHDFRSTAKRPYSVPYAIGSIVSRLGARM